jgi:hypothetical protein
MPEPQCRKHIQELVRASLAALGVDLGVTTP